MKKVIFWFVVAALTGAICGYYSEQILQQLKQLPFHNASVYSTENEALTAVLEQQQVQRIGWDDLLPEQDKAILNHYQNDRPDDPTEQILRSIQASNDERYLSALYSMNTVPALADRLISLPGYLVPIELAENRMVSRMFLVPYFGACIHYPPPAPNQMVYIQLPSPIQLPDINEAYMATGVLNVSLYEDLLGTSAYSLNLIQLTLYSGEPDDVRQH